MKLAQGQIWETAPEVHSYEGKSLYIRIVDLDRKTVRYKEMLTKKSKNGYNKEATKKAFCVLIKHARLSPG